MEEIHLNQFPANDTTVLITNDFLNQIKVKLRKKHNNTRSLYKSFGDKMPFATFKHSLEPSFASFRPLRLILYICDDVGIDIEELEKNVESYRTKKGRITVKSPNLPVIVSPIFDMLIAHTIADGTCRRIKGRIPSFDYRQYKNDILSLYIQKMERVFGTLQFKKENFFLEKRVRMPSSASYVMYSFYSMKPEDFLENNAYLPDKLFCHSNEHLLAVLIAFILDEGTVDSSDIVIGLKNRRLLDDLKRICNRLGYKNNLVYKKERGYLYILADGVKTFWHDYEELKRKYPEVSLDYKEHLIENFIIRKSKKWRSFSQGTTQNNILSLLNQSNKSIKEISLILRISRQGIKFHIKKLEELGLIKRIGKGYANSDVYTILKYKTLPVKKKGRSKQYGVSNQTILELLGKKSLTTREISDAINVHISTTLSFLVNMENERKIVRVGEKILKTHPSIVWKLA